MVVLVTAGKAVSTRSPCMRYGAKAVPAGNGTDAAMVTSIATLPYSSRSFAVAAVTRPVAAITGFSGPGGPVTVPESHRSLAV